MRVCVAGHRCVCVCVCVRGGVGPAAVTYLISHRRAPDLESLHRRAGLSWRDAAGLSKFWGALLRDSNPQYEFDNWE